MKALLVCLVVAVLPLSLACSGGNDQQPGDGTLTTDPPDSTPEGGPVPAATLSASGGVVSGGVGTRCWGRLCIDYLGAISNTTPFVVKPGETVALTFEAGAPTRVQLEWRSAGMEPTPVEGGLLWAGPLSAGSPVATGSMAPVERGRYLLTVFAQWAGRGDILYGFYTEVR